MMPIAVLGMAVAGCWHER